MLLYTISPWKHVAVRNIISMKQSTLIRGFVRDEQEYVRKCSGNF